MHLFLAPLDTCLNSPLLCQPLSSRFAPHGLGALETGAMTYTRLASLEQSLCCNLLLLLCCSLFLLRSCNFHDLLHHFLVLVTRPKYPPYCETGVAMPLPHCVFCGIADYRCYTPTSSRTSGLSRSKNWTRGASQKKLASEACPPSLRALEKEPARGGKREGEGGEGRAVA